jgi:hypothetical protein
VLQDSLTFQLQNEQHEIGWYRVNFNEKAIYMAKNMHIGSFHVNGKNQPFISSSIVTDPDFSGCQKLQIYQLTNQIFEKKFNFEKFKMAAGKL